MRISDWSSDVCSSDLEVARHKLQQATAAAMRASYDPANLSPDDALSFELFNAQAAREESLFAFRHHNYLFNQMRGAQSQMPAFLINRSEERRVGKEWVSTCRSRGSPYN